MNLASPSRTEINLILFGILLAAISPALALDATSFGSQTDFPANSGQVGAAFGDLDGDGKPDAAAANYWTGDISVYRNLSSPGAINSGSFAARVNFATGSTPILVRLTDVDGDGKTDILVINQGGSLSILRNTSTPGVIDVNSFAPSLNLAIASEPRWVAAGDLNGDGKPDLAVASYSPGVISLFENQSTPGTLSFGPRTDLTSNEPSVSIEAADMDGDGKTDLVVGDINNATASVWRNVHSSGPLTMSSFAPRVSFSVGGGPSITLGDIDGDGKTDILTPNQFANTLSVLRNTSSPGVIDASSFAPKVNFNTGGYPYSAVAVDLDGDGKADIAVANASSHTVSVFRNLATNGAFTPASLDSRLDYATGTGPRILSALDLDGDGLVDLATPNLSQNSFSVLRQTSGANTNTPPQGTNADFVLGRDFSRLANPNGVWSYGWKQTMSGAFTTLTQPWTASTDNGVPIHGWILAGYGQPAVYANDGTGTGSSAGGQLTAPPGTVWMHPGLNGRPENFGTIRFTAPSNGNYRVDATADPLYTGFLSGDTDFHVAVAGNEIFSQFLAARAGTAFSNTLALTAGDAIDFAIGRGADGDEYGAGLKLAVTIAPTSTPGVVITNQPPVTNTPPSVASDFNLGRDFSASANPNGVWSCGWKQTMSGAFTTLTQPWTASTDNGVPIHGWVLPSFGQPAVYANDGTGTGSSASGQLTAPPGTVWMHPGINGRPENFGAVRFTAPSNGNYRVNVAANSLYTGFLSGDTDFHVAVGNTEVFGQFLAARAGTSYSNTLALAAGDTVDFGIGRGADGNEYGAGLKLALVITPTTDAGVVITNTPPDTNAPPAAPVIVTQPAPYQSVAAGATVNFAVNVSGEAPFTFQWLFNGYAIPGATAPTFKLTNTQPANAGTYRVVVNNPGGSVTSDAATLNVSDLVSGGTVNFANTSANRVLDAVGTNFVPAGGSMVVGLFAGAAADSLAQVGGLTSFISPGRFSGGTRYVPGVPAGQTAFVQARVWDSAFGSTHEQAVAAGSKHGASAVFQLILGGGVTPPPNLSLMPAFTLQLPALPAPQITAQPASQLVPLGASATLTAAASGGGISWQWFRNAVAKPGASSATLEIAHAQKSDAGEYFAVASNSGGAATSQVATLSVTIERTLALISQPDAGEGALVSVPVVLESSGDVGGMTFVLHYNSDLLSTPEVIWDAAVSNGLQAANVPSLGRVQASFALPGTTIPSGTQTLAVVNFRARTVVTNSTSELFLEILDVANAAGDLIEFGTDVRNGEVTVLPGAGLAGDNNGNGVLDIGDASLLLRMLAQLDSTRAWDLLLNDLNQNARADSGDAIRILLAAAQIAASNSPSLVHTKDMMGPAAEAAVLAPMMARGSNGLVTFHVRLQNIRGQISGAAFTLNYPVAALRIASAQAQVVGPMVPAGTVVLWNLSPTNNYGQQDGRVRLVASSGAAWPSATGMLAQFTFQVQPGATNQFAWPLAVSSAEVSALGYTRPVAGGRAHFVGRNARPGMLVGPTRLTNGPCRFSLTGDTDATYAIEASTNLIHWSVLTNMANPGGKIIFDDPDAAGMPHRFYRTRPVQP